MRLTKYELKFILLATNVSSGVYDYENYNEEEFKKHYGLSIDDANYMLEGLNDKCHDALSKIESRLKK
jgi:hypothetical protein